MVADKCIGVSRYSMARLWSHGSQQPILHRLQRMYLRQNQLERLVWLMIFLLSPCFFCCILHKGTILHSWKIWGLAKAFGVHLLPVSGHLHILPVIHRHQPTNGHFKGTVSRDFLLQVFSWITFPQAPDNNIRIFSNFYENSRRYSQVKVHRRYQQHRRRICHRYQRHWGQILPPVPLVLLTPVANCRRCQRRR